ncbi:MAG: pyridoxal phosphate-dependent aminotransferase [Phycisphaerales bacterium]|nr:pyridoxal phosphate-dependent aminotransferase [Phycisphaerales bacterium]
MSISQLARQISESATLKINELAATLAAKGEPVIHLGGGEPKSKPPLDALVAAAAQLHTGEIRYTPADGLPALKKAIIRYMEEHYAHHVKPEHVLVSNGAKQAIMVALQTILNPHDEVIFPAPYWVSYPEMVRLCGGIPVQVVPEDGSFCPRLQDIVDRVGPDTKAIIINSPNNPTGIIYPAEFIAEIVQFCEQHELYLIMDDIYHRLAFDGVKPANCYAYAGRKDENSRLIVVNGVSKAYAMTGFRIGWAVANKRLIEAMANVQAHQTSGPSALLQHAAVGALLGVQSGVEALRLTLENNRNVMLARLAGIPGVHVEKPQGTFYCFADFRHYDPDSTRLARLLLGKVRVVTVPGVEFGLEGHLRLSYCGTVKDITEGLERIKWALDPEAPNEIYIGDRRRVRDWALPGLAPALP